MTVYVVFNVFLLGKTVSGVYAVEVDALRAAHAGDLPQGVMRRTVEPYEVIPAQGGQR